MMLKIKLQFIFILEFVSNSFFFSEMPYGQVPVLEVDGKKIAQSVAICRYVGNLGKLSGDNELDKFEIDSVVDSFSEVQKSEYMYTSCK